MKTNMRDTSLLAYVEVLQNLGERQAQVYKAIRELSSCSNTMISRHIHLPINCIVGRTNELRRRKVVGYDKKGMCPITNKLVIFWKVIRKL